MSDQIQGVIDSFRNSKLLVVGDLILDHYAFGNVNRVSPEAPIQVLDIAREEFRLGGACNVACNLVALGPQVGMVGIAGNDDHANHLYRLLKDWKISHRGIFSDTSRPTTVKTRFIAQGHHLLRVDRETRTAISQQMYDHIANFVEQHLEECQGLVISDYAKGVLTHDLCQTLISIAGSRGKKTFVGPKGKSWQRYRGATLISANRSETQDVTNIVLKTKDDVAAAAETLISQLKVDTVVVTLGAEGMYVHSHTEGQFYIQAQAREVFDVAGAGDTVLSLLSLAASNGYSWEMAARLANTAAGIVVAKIGTATVSPTELAKKFSQQE